MRVTLDSIFKDHMVLQRQEPVEFFGTGEPDSQIKVTFAKKEQITEVDKDGIWKVTYDPFVAGGPYEIVVEDIASGEKIHRIDFMVGDVYVAAGQSNMEFLFENSFNAECEKENADLKNFRYYKVPQVEYMKDGKEYPEIADEGWFICNPQNVGKISGVAYYFAKEIMKHTDVTIGIVGCHKGGTSASCWVQEEYLKKTPILKKRYYDDYWGDIEGQTDEEEDEKREQYQQILAEYNQKVKDYQEKYPERSTSQLKHDVGHTPWPGPKGLKDYGRPCGLYETIFKKILGVRYKAVLWYQGEEDTKFADSYKDLLLNLIDNWRKDLKDSQLPFFVIQLPDYNDDKIPFGWAVLREQQRLAVCQSEETELVCALGCGEEFNIHPADKSELGRRLGLMVTEYFYDFSEEGHSPEIEKVCREGAKYLLEFKNTYGKAFAAKKESINLDISYDGTKYETVEADIDGNRLIIESEKAVKAIRYDWENCPEVYVMGVNNLPVIPFQYVVEGKDLK